VQARCLRYAWRQLRLGLIEDALVRTYFGNPYLLLLTPLYGAFLWAWWRRQPEIAFAFRRRVATKTVFHACAAICLVLAAAGLRVPAHAPRQELVAVADLSDSVFDQATQTVRLNEALAALDPDSAQAGIVVFGRTAGLERALGPLTPPRGHDPLPGRLEVGSASPDAPGRRAALHSPREVFFVDLTRSATVVDHSATDIGGAVSFGRGLFPAGSTGFQPKGSTGVPPVRMGETPMLRDVSAARAILLLSDFRETCGSAEAAAAALAGSGVDLLALPAVLGPSSDVRIAAVNVPQTGRLGRDLPVEVAVASQSPCTARVAVWKKGVGSEDTPVDFKTVTLSAEPGSTRSEIRKLVRVLDHPAAPGVAVYTARVSGPDGDLPGDITLNNELCAAARITGVSRWAVLTRPGSTLARLSAEKAQPLGVETEAFIAGNLPQRAAAYDPFAGVVVDGLSAAELPEGPVLRALADAVENGKALLALGGERAYGAGGHREGTWERLLPVEMTPEDDRTRSVLFIIDVSKSMEERMGRDRSGVRKIDFASEQLALAVQKLKPLDRVGLISFSGTAELVAPLSAEASRSAFLTAVKNVAILSNTDLVPALKKARDVLKDDNAEEQLLVLLSDGVQTVPRPEADIIQAAKDLCPPSSDPAKPRRSSLFTFGIDVDARDASPAGEKLLKALAEAGGGTYSPEFLRLAERLEQALIGAKKDFFVRREPFVPRPAYEHPLLAALGIPSRGGQQTVLPFRNRVKAKPAAEVLLWSAPIGSAGVPPGVSVADQHPSKPDPILTISGPAWPGVSRRAALAVSLDGEAGTALLGSDSGRKLLPALLEWAEAKSEASVPGWDVSADASDDETLAVEVRVRDPASGLPLNGLKLSATLTALQLSASQPGASAPLAPPSPPWGEGRVRGALLPIPLHASAPGAYSARVPKPPQGVYRLNILEAARGSAPVCERFVTVPYPAELRRFGTDRAAMQKLVSKAGGDSRIIENPQDLARWAADKSASRETYSLRPWLIALGMLLLLAEYALRGRKPTR